jgi:parallel beta-helix repeat protein
LGRYRTVNGGLSCISPGDTLKVKNGIYNYSFPPNPIPAGNSNTSKTCIVGESRDGVIFRPDASKASNVFSFGKGQDNLCFRNMTLDGANQGSVPRAVAGFSQGGGGGFFNWEITDMVIKNFGVNQAITDPNYNGGQGQAMVLDSLGGNHYIARVIFDKNGTENQYRRIGGHIYFRASNTIVEHSYFRDAANNALSLWSSGGSPITGNIFRYNYFISNFASGVSLFTATNNTVHDNVFIGPGGYGVRARRSGNKVNNNTFYGPFTSACLSLEGASHEVSKNILLNCGGTAIRNESSGSTLSNNPTSGKASDIFVDPEGGDFTLKTAIGVGATIPTVNTTLAPSTILNPPPTPGNLQAVAK